jgi:hypothetical protein
MLTGCHKVFCVCIHMWSLDPNNSQIVYWIVFSGHKVTKIERCENLCMLLTKEEPIHFSFLYHHIQVTHVLECSSWSTAQIEMMPQKYSSTHDNIRVRGMIVNSP